MTRTTKAIGLALAAVLVLAASAAAAELPLRVVSQDATTWTIGWTPQQGAYGYRFFRDAQPVSSTFNAAQTTVRFSKGATTYGVTTLLVGDVGTINPSAPPPPVDVCPNIPGVQETIPPGMVKDAAGNCVPAPPPSGNNLTVTDRTWVCSGTVNYNVVKVTIRQSLPRTDAVRIASGCNGTVQRLEVDTANADGIHVGAGAHDFTINGGYVHSSAVCGSCGAVHVDGVQVLGGQRITFRNLDVNYPTATNSALYINAGAAGQERPTDVVCDGCTFRRSPDKNRVVRIGNSLRSGIRNSTVYWCGTGPTCDAPQAPAIWFNGLQTDPVNSNNRLIAVGG